MVTRGRMLLTPLKFPVMISDHIFTHTPPLIKVCMYRILSGLNRMGMWRLRIFSFIIYKKNKQTKQTLAQVRNNHTASLFVTTFLIILVEETTSNLAAKKRKGCPRNCRVVDLQPPTSPHPELAVRCLVWISQVTRMLLTPLFLLYYIH